MTIKEMLEHSIVISETFRQFSKGHLLAFIFHYMIAGIIPILMFPVAPCAITFFIIAVIVEAVQCEPVTWPHVSIKGYEVRLPFIAHSDPATSISGIGMMLRIIASRFRLSPCNIFSRRPHTVTIKAVVSIFGFNCYLRRDILSLSHDVPFTLWCGPGVLQRFRSFALYPEVIAA